MSRTEFLEGQANSLEKRVKNLEKEVADLKKGLKNKVDKPYQEPGSAYDLSRSRPKKRMI